MNGTNVMVNSSLHLHTTSEAEESLFCGPSTEERLANKRVHLPPLFSSFPVIVAGPSIYRLTAFSS